MSAVTLETLKADFEAAVAELDKHWVVKVPGTLSDGSTYTTGVRANTPAAKKAKERYNFALGALHVAYQHGLNAAWLYKQSKGFIDPRKGEVRS